MDIQLSQWFPVDTEDQGSVPRWRRPFFGIPWGVNIILAQLSVHKGHGAFTDESDCRAAVDFVACVDYEREPMAPGHHLSGLLHRQGTLQGK